MKDFELKDHNRIELSVKQKKQIEYELIGNIIPHKNHTMWEINNETLEISKAKFINKPIVVIGEEVKNRILAREGFSYVSALTKKTALEKFKKGDNGSKKIDKNILPL